MAGFTLFLLIINTLLFTALTIESFRKIKNNTRKIDKINKEIVSIKEYLRSLVTEERTIVKQKPSPAGEQAAATAQVKPTITPKPTTTPEPMAAKETVQPAAPVEKQTPAPEKQQQKTPVTAVKKEPKKITKKVTKVVKEKVKSEWLLKLEKQFSENWIGIIGTILLIIGIGILGVYGALKFKPLYRFFILIGVAVMLTVLHFILKRHAVWSKIATWFRSAAGAIFLFAALGAGGIPGLQWIFDLKWGLLMLMAGIAINLMLATIGKKQLVASLHVLLSLIALSIAPQGLIPFALASIVTLYGIILIFKEKWEYHMLLTTTCYFIYIIYYRSAFELTQPYHFYAGLGAVILINATALFMHYRTIYKTTGFEVKPFVVHLLNWMYMGLGLLIFAPGKPWVAIPIAAGAVAIFFAARFAKKRGIRWVYLTDTVIAQITAIVACISLFRWEVKIMPIATIIFIETIAYTLIMIFEKERLLKNIGLYMQSAAAIALVFITFSIIRTDMGASIFGYSALILGTALAAYLFYLYHQKQLKPSGTADILAPGIKKAAVIITAIIALLATNLILYVTAGEELIEKIPVGYGFVLSLLIFLNMKNRLPHKPLDFINRLLLQIISYIALGVLSAWRHDNIIIIGLMIAVTLLYSFKYLLRKQGILLIISNIFLIIFMFVMFLFNMEEFDIEDGKVHVIYTGVVAGVFVLSALFYLISRKKEAPLYESLTNKTVRMFITALTNIIGFIIATLIMLINLNLNDNLPWPPYLGSEYLIVLPFAALIIIRNHKQCLGLGIGILVTTLVLFISQWVDLYNLSLNTWQAAVHSLPLFIIPLVMIKFSFFNKTNRYHPWIGLYVLYIHLCFTIYFIFKPVSPLIAGVIYIILAAVNLEIARYFNNKEGDTFAKKGFIPLHVMTTGYLLILTFLIRHILVHLQSEVYLVWLFKARFLIEILAIMILVYFFIQPKKSLPEHRLISYVQPLFLELSILFTTFTVIVEITQFYHPLIWVITAIIFLLLGKKLHVPLSRLQFYSLLLFYGACFHITFISSPYFNEVVTTFNLKWFLACVAIPIQFVYIYFTHNKDTLIDITFPRPLTGLAKLCSGIQKRKYAFIYYPLFFSIALFFIWSFDRSILTALLTAEAFMIFVLSVILRENHFRYFSMLAILGCVVRLIVSDLVKAHTLAKALVCIAVAILLIGMNLIANKYKERFNKNEQE